MAREVAQGVTASDRLSAPDEGMTAGYGSTLAKACARAGLDGRRARLLRLGENAIYALPAHAVVVRIARTTAYLPDVEKEIAVARWLASADYPAARLAELDQPLMVDGRVVTFWQLINSAEPRPDVRDLGRLLRTLHALPMPEGVPLRHLDPFGRVERRLAVAPASVGRDALSFLRARTESLRGEYEQLDFALPGGPIHGDAHTGNLMRDGTGTVRLIDFEAFAWGPREWDLSIAAGHYQGFEWISRDEYERFADAYGYDVLSWPGYRTIRAVRELTMTTWLMQNVDERDEVAVEFTRRLADLRDDSTPRRWTAM